MLNATPLSSRLADFPDSYRHICTNAVESIIIEPHHSLHIDNFYRLFISNELNCFNAVKFKTLKQKFTTLGIDFEQAARLTFAKTVSKIHCFWQRTYSLRLMLLPPDGKVVPISFIDSSEWSMAQMALIPQGPKMIGGWYMYALPNEI